MKGLRAFAQLEMNGMVVVVRFVSQALSRSAFESYASQNRGMTFGSRYRRVLSTNEGSKRNSANGKQYLE